MNGNRYQAHGHMEWIGETEVKGSKGFRVRQFAIVIDGKYPETPVFQVTRDNCEMLDQYQIGEPVLVHFNLKGRKWQDRYFGNNECWKMEKTEHPGDRDERLERNAYAKKEHYDHAGLDERGEAFDDSDIPF
jgi:hypothetical protein